MRNILLTAIVFFLFPFNTVFTQQYSLKQLTAPDADFPTEIYSMTFDRQGLLWLASPYYLYTYNGNTLTQIRNTEKQALRAYSIFESGKDSMLIANFPAGIRLLNKGVLSVLPLSDSITDIVFFSSLPNNDILLGTKKGLLYWDKKKFTSFPEMKGTYISDYSKDEKGTHYLYTGKGIYKLQNNKLTFILNPGTETGRILASATGTLYYSATKTFTESNLYKWDGKTSTLIQAFVSPPTQIIQINRKDIYVVCGNVYSLKNDSIEEFASYPNQKLFKIIPDKNNDMLILGVNYIYYLSKNFYTLKKMPDQTFLLCNRVIYNNTNKIYLTAAGRWWVRQGKDSFDLYKTYKELANLPTGNFRDCIFMEDGSFYISSMHQPSGYYYFKKDKTVKFVKTHPEYTTSVFLPDKNKKGVWLKNGLGPLYIENGIPTLYSDIKKYSIENENLQTCIADPIYNWIWCFTRKGEICYFDKDKDVFHKLPNLNIGTPGEVLRITNILSDKQNNIWIAVLSKGIYKLTRNPAKPNEFSKAQYWDTIPALGRFSFDDHGNLWCIYQKLFKIYKAGKDSTPVSPSQFREIATSSDLEENYKETPHFVISDTQPRDSLALFSYVAKCTYTFGLEALFKKTSGTGNPATITNVKLNDNSNWEKLGFLVGNNGLPQNPVLAYNQNNLSFTYTTLYSFFRSKIFYKIRLAGFDTSWHSTVNSFINYTNLIPGAYSFQVMYSFDNISWSNATSFNFTIEKPWWTQWWFRLLEILFLLFFILLIVKLRVRSLEIKKRNLETLVNRRTLDLKITNEELQISNEQNEMLLGILAHDIKGPLRFSQNVAEELNNNWNKIADSNRKNYVAELHKSIASLLRFTNEFLIWIKAKKNKLVLDSTSFSIAELFNKIVSFYTETADINNNQYIITAEEGLLINSDPQVLEIIIRNLVDNASKYTYNGSITLNSFRSDKNIIIECTDSGTGMTPGEIDSILVKYIPSSSDKQSSYKLGFLYINELVKLLHGKIEILSEKGKGTTVRLTI